MHKHHNGLKTAALFGVLWAVLLGLGAFIAAGTRSAAPIWIMALIGVAHHGLRLLEQRQARHPRHAGLSRHRGRGAPAVPDRPGAVRPRPASRCRGIYVSPTMAPNAFATGRNPQNAAVCCTEGILRLLDERELRGVLGHELMHVYNRDILTASVAAAVAGVITSVAQMFAACSAAAGTDATRNPIAAIAMALLAPFAASLIQMAISRTREYDADEDGATLTGDPLALASALRKIEQGVQLAPLPQDQRLVNASHMMIANPFRGGGRRQDVLHPPADGRADRPAGADGRPAAGS